VKNRSTLRAGLLRGRPSSPCREPIRALGFVGNVANVSEFGFTAKLLDVKRLLSYEEHC
jgi:hypothetical protein